MSKSIVVIDTPESCDKCPLFFGFYSDMTCKVNGKGIDYPYPDDKVQEWCPLKEVPEKKNEKEYLTRMNSRGDVETYGERTDRYGAGWNACIDEILAE